MPNAKVRSEKEAIVADLTHKLQNAAAGVLVDYKGITVAEDTALRTELRKNNVEYAVVKNTLLQRAVNNCGMNELDSLLNGATALAILLPPLVWSTTSPRKSTVILRSRADSWMASLCLSMRSWPWPPFPRCLFCRLRSWVQCWLPFPGWPVCSSRLPRSRVRLPRLPPPNKRPVPRDIEYLLKNY